MDKAKLISALGLHPSDTSVTFHAGYDDRYHMEVMNFGVHTDYEAQAPSTDPLAPRPMDSVMVNVTIRITDKLEEIVDAPEADAD